MTTMVTEKPASQEVTRTEPAWNRPLFRPNVDILERADELTILADIPGASPEDIDIRFENGTLTIHAKVRKRQARDTGYALTEYGIGDFQHTFQVSETIDSQRINAEYRDGVLTLQLPKIETARSRKIAVKAE